MKILVTGANGNVGKLVAQAFRTRGHDSIGTDIDDLDITVFEPVLDRLDALRPDLVVHCAALTNVDLCAEQPELAVRVNGIGTQNLALGCQRIGAALCYVSSNEVFGGQQETPYQEYDTPRPINPYGYSKWVGEQMVRDLLPRHFIVRLSWLFAHSGANFLQKIVQKAVSGQALSVVTDEIASPTYADDFVQALLALLETARYGIYHLPNAGYTSRYDFARYILDCYGYTDTVITPVLSTQYKRPSKPPAYSALSNVIAAHMGIRLRSWQEAVSAFVERERSSTPESK